MDENHLIVSKRGGEVLNRIRDDWQHNVQDSRNEVDNPFWPPVGIPPSALTPRILYDDVAPGGNGLAWPVDATMAADTSATKVTVYATFPGLYRGLGTNHTGFTPSPTAKIWTTMGTDGHETIVVGLGQAKECTCQLTGALTATTSSCTVDTVIPTDGGQNPVSNSTSATMTVYIRLNPSSSGGYAGADNTVAKIKWSEVDEKYYIEDMPCAA